MANMYANMKWDLKDESSRTRCATRLLSLRQYLDEHVRRHRSDGNLLLATWNIRDFDSNRFGYGPRLPESFYYVAEIISSFDLVAVQEVNRDLRPLEKVMKILGREWDYIVTDTTEGKGGNGERMAFLYNREKVWFRKVAGEVVLPEGQMIVAPKTVKENGEKLTHDQEMQFSRSPFLVAFQSGWFRFSLCTVHIYYGAASGEKLERRIAEIQSLVRFFAARQDEASKWEVDRFGAPENYVLLGDFNVVKPNHRTMDALKTEGFDVPDAIDGDEIRKKGMHYYDQIAVRVKDPRFEVVRGGILDMYEQVFRDDDLEAYERFMPSQDPDPQHPVDSPDKLFKKWRTWQMSDHFPLWIEIRTDYSDDYLQRLAAGREA
jgi:endonuclease/exonuclease/phosphatase family metal-dependent hydrolase